MRRYREGKRERERDRSPYGPMQEKVTMAGGASPNPIAGSYWHTAVRSRCRWTRCCTLEMYVNVYICIHMRTHTQEYVYIYIYIYMYVYTYVSLCIYKKDLHI